MPRIFISYRRDDSGYIAGMLAERLEEVFGSDSVFIDVDAIPLGVDFREYLNQAVARSDLMLALIGNEWLNVQNAQGLRRLEDPADFVRIEIEAALKQQIPVVPVLLEQARMPLEAELPASLQPLAFRNAVEIRSGRDLNYHIEQLIRGIKTHYGRNITKPSSEANEGSAAQVKPSTPQENKTETLAAPQPTTSEKPPKLNVSKWLFGLVGAAVSLTLIAWGLNFLWEPKPDETKHEPSSLSMLKSQQALTPPTPIVQPLIPLDNQSKANDYSSKVQLSTSAYFQPCMAGTRNVIVGSGYGSRAEALAGLEKFRARYPNYSFKLLDTVASDSNYNNEQTAIVAGHGLDNQHANQLIHQLKREGMAAYATNQTVASDCIDISGSEN